MESIKTVYEIRYPKLLNFNLVYKDIINPYFIYPNAGFQIHNEGQHTENIQMNFPDSNHILIFRYDRISFHFDGSYNELMQSGSNIEMCFDIWEQLKKVVSFLKISAETLEIIAFKEIETEDEIAELFAAKSNLNPYLNNPIDFKIIESSIEGNQTISLEYGPFNAETDITHQRLFTMNKSRAADFIDKRGILCKCSISGEKKKVSKKGFKEVVKKCENLLTSVFESYD